jgi:hypothetical protein
MAERGRPEVLFPLFAGLETLDGVGPKIAKNFAGLAVETPKDLVLTLPQGGIDRALKASIRDVAIPGTATVEVTIGRHRPPSGRGPYRVEVDDAATRFELVFFHARGDYLQKLLPTGARRVVSGRWSCSTGWRRWPIPTTSCPPEEAGTLPAYRTGLPADRRDHAEDHVQGGAIGAGPAAGAARMDRPGAEAAEGLARLAHALRRRMRPRGRRISRARPRRGSGWPSTS